MALIDGIISIIYEYRRSNKGDNVLSSTMVGYIGLVNSDKLYAITTLYPRNTLHTKAFKYVYGKDLTDMVVIGGGFAIMNGDLRFNSGTFNPMDTGYHDKNREMDNFTKQSIEVAVRNWKNEKQNTYASGLAKYG